MSHQKHRVSAKDLPRTAPQRHRKKHSQNFQVNFSDYDYEAEKFPKRKSAVREDTSSSYEEKKYERPKRRKHRRHTDQSEINILKQKLNEIDTLREQIEVFQSILSSRENVQSDHKNVRWLTSSCFSFISALACKKSKPEIVEISGNSSKLSQYRDENSKNRKKFKREKKSELPHKGKEKDSSKQHKITNNNTIVLPESYALSRQQSGDQFLINNLNKQLEVQVSEIKEIKQTLKECINLLKGSGFTEANRYTRSSFPYLLDDFINLNRVVPAKFDNLFPNPHMEEGFLSILNHSERRLDQPKSTDGTNTQVQLTPAFASTESLQLSRRISKTTLTSDHENRFPEIIRDVYCNKKKDKETVLKVSPFRCGVSTRCYNPPKSVTKPLSKYTVVETQRKRNKMINKGRKPGRLKGQDNEKSSYFEKKKKPEKKSCFVRFMRFICCKNN